MSRSDKFKSSIERPWNWVCFQIVVKQMKETNDRLPLDSWHTYTVVVLAFGLWQQQEDHQELQQSLGHRNRHDLGDTRSRELPHENCQRRRLKPSWSARPTGSSTCRHLDQEQIQVIHWQQQRVSKICEMICKQNFLACVIVLNNCGAILIYLPSFIDHQRITFTIRFNRSPRCTHLYKKKKHLATQDKSVVRSVALGSSLVCKRLIEDTRPHTASVVRSLWYCQRSSRTKTSRNSWLSTWRTGVRCQWPRGPDAKGGHCPEVQAPSPTSVRVLFYCTSRRQSIPKWIISIRFNRNPRCTYSNKTKKKQLLLTPSSRGVK
jgi:hypothetical protein